MAKAGFKLKGMKKLLRNLENEIQGIEDRTLNGLLLGAIEIQRAAEPGTPVDEGNLRASYFITSYRGRAPTLKRSDFKGKRGPMIRGEHKKRVAQASQLAKALGRANRPVVIFGYSANYAAFVHEMTGANFKREGARARWFYAAIKRTQSTVIEIIKREAQIR